MTFVVIAGSAVVVNDSKLLRTHLLPKQALGIDDTGTGFDLDFSFFFQQSVSFASTKLTGMIAKNIATKIAIFTRMNMRLSPVIRGNLSRSNISTTTQIREWVGKL